ncbi:MAG: hypothetical protein IT352_05925 [Gemmatimonadales bacterium]|nr:hypothetical protein [Gemmatimonadales bacterium]
MLRSLIAGLRHELELTTEARAVRRRDRHTSGLGADPGPLAAANLALKWLSLAQDRSRSNDGGVARAYSLLTGWQTSYPETTGYIVPTFLDASKRLRDPDLEHRGARMLDWLVSLQHPDGGFPGGMIGKLSPGSVTFNTGQILLGLASGVSVFGDRYRESATRAAEMLASSLDPDGCWRRHPTPFAKGGDKAYETHVAWGLFEAARSLGESRFLEAGLRQVRWALTQQRPNGWFDQCCLYDNARPLTHTLGYVLRGLLEAWEHTSDPALLASIRRTADGLLGAQRPDGALPGRLGPEWTAEVEWSCLTGNVQVAYCWLRLAEATGDDRYRRAGKAANAFTRRTLIVSGPEQQVGAVRGSYPVDGAYGRYEFLNWAAKFLVDACFKEHAMDGGA